MLVCRFKNKLKVSPLKSSFQTILQTVVYFVSLFQMIYFEVFPSCKFLLMTFSFISLHHSSVYSRGRGVLPG